MIHITDGQSDGILDVITAKHIISNNHRQSLKDTLETFEFRTFADKPFSEHLGKHNRVIIPAEDKGFIEFIIHEAGKYRDTEGLKAEVYASASYLLLKKASIIEPQTLSEQTASTAVSHSLDGTEWQAGIIEGKGYHTFHIEKHTNPFAFLKVIAKAFGLKLHFRVETDGNQVTGRYVDLLEQIGQWRGREAEFGKDLIGIRRTEKTDVYTALKGLGPEREDGTRLEVFIEDKEALQRWGRPNKQGVLQHLVDVYEPQSSDQDMTLDRLTTLTENELKKRVNSVVEYESTIADLENVPGMENKKIRFGDTIKTKDIEFNPPLYLEARVHTQDRSITDKSRKQVKLGDYIEYTEDEVKAIWQSLQAEIQRRLARMLLITIESSTGDVFKNGVGSTDLTATVFLTGNQVDETGDFYSYYWKKYDKQGIPISGYGKAGKTITVTAAEIDEKASFHVEISLGDGVLAISRITISNVFDGSQGVPGPPGEDGRTPYFHTAYADSADGITNFSVTDPADRDYIGTYTDYTALDSTNPSKYAWQKVKGEDGYTPIKGIDYFDGVNGNDGDNGLSSYLHVRYSLNSSGSGMTTNPSGAKYIGIAVTQSANAPTSYTAYKWSLVKGSDGLPGETGDNGKTSYLHIKYSNNGGATFTANAGEAVGDWIGTYVDFNSTDSTNVTSYTWNKVKGDKGDPGGQGIPGEPGEDGQSLYTWIKYANSPTSGMSDSPTNKKYIGLAYNKTTATESNTYADYEWAKVEGEQGVPGVPGDDGEPRYTWVKYADDENGAGMSDSSKDKRYLGLAYNKLSATESSNAVDYTWNIMFKEAGRNLINNPATTGNIEGWSHSAVSGALTKVKQLFFGSEIDVLESDSPSNIQNYSPYFDVDPTKAYEVSIWAKVASPNSGSHFYLGVNSTPNTVESSDTSTGGTWADSTNFYFFSTSSQTALSDWYKITGYILPVGIDKAKNKGLGENVTRNMRMKNEHTRIRLRFLNWANAGVARKIWVANPTVREVPAEMVGLTNDKINQAKQNANTHANNVSEAAYIDAVNDAEAYMQANGIMQGKDYNGVSITNTDGFVTARGDGLVRTVQNSTLGYVIQRRDRVSHGWTNVLYFDTNGNIKYAGDLEGASGTFKGSIETPRLNIHNPDIKWDGGVGLTMQVAKWQADVNNPYIETGKVLFNTANNALEVYMLDLNGVEVPLDGFSVNAKAFKLQGKLYTDTITLNQISAGNLDKYGNIYASPTSTSTAYWNLQDYKGDVIFKAPWGSAGGPFEIRQTGFHTASLENGWSHYSSSFPSGGYMKDSDGFVNLRGLIKGGSLGAAAFTLPAGYRPYRTMSFGAIDSTNVPAARINVYESGSVQVRAGNNNYVSLDNVRFWAER